MKININNYEAYLVDYIDGQLDTQLCNELKAFLLRHPELGSFEELTGDMPFLDSTEINCPNKNNLLKPDLVSVGAINENNYTDYIIAYYEKTLNPTETSQLLEFVKINAEAQNDFQLYGKTYLKANENIVFPNKERLLHRITLSLHQWQFASIAASIALLFGLFWFVNDHNNDYRMAYAEIPNLSSKSFKPFEDNFIQSLASRNINFGIFSIASDEPENIDVVPTARENNYIACNMPTRSAGQFTPSEYSEIYVKDIEKTFLERNWEAILAAEFGNTEIVDPNFNNENLNLSKRFYYSSMLALSNDKYQTIGEIWKQNKPSGTEDAFRKIIKTSVKTYYAIKNL